MDGLQILLCCFFSFSCSFRDRERKDSSTRKSGEEPPSTTRRERVHEEKSDGFDQLARCDVYDIRRAFRSSATTVRITWLFDAESLEVVFSDCKHRFPAAFIFTFFCGLGSWAETEGECRERGQHHVAPTSRCLS